MTDFQQPTNFTVQNLRELRKQTGMSRRVLIERLGEHGIEMHPNSLRRIEEGHQPMKVQEVLAFAEIFNIDLTEFITQPINPASAKIEGAVQELQELLDDAHHQMLTFTILQEGLKRSLSADNLPPAEQSTTVREGEDLYSKTGDIWEAYKNLSEALGAAGYPLEKSNAYRRFQDKLAGIKDTHDDG